MCCLEIKQLVFFFFLKNASVCFNPLHVPDRWLLSDFYFPL